MLVETSGTVTTDTNALTVEVPTSIPESDASRLTRLYDSRTCGVRITRRALRGALLAARSFACEDPTRFHLASVAFHASDLGMLECVATDGHTLARVRVPAVIHNAKALPSARLIVPTESVDEMIKALTFKRKADGDSVVSLELQGTGKTIVSGQIALSITATDAYACRLIEAQYPTIEQVIPHPNSRKCDGVIGVNPYYLARACEAIRHMGRDANAPRGMTMRIGAELDPIRLDYSHPKHGEFLGVVMPMRL